MTGAWRLAPLGQQERNDLLEIIDDRTHRSTVITSQLPIEKWHEYLGEPTLADAILDRLLHNAHKIQLQGESMRKKVRLID
jgi:DNA replication protein DnaC